MDVGVGEVGPGPAEVGGAILIVDDDPDVGGALHTLLAIHGYDVRLASNRLEAEVLLNGGAPFDAVVVDLCLGNRKSFDLIELLASGEVRHGPIVITGTSDAGDRAECIARGALHVFPKPLDTPALLAALGSEVTRMRRNRRMWAQDLARSAGTLGTCGPERTRWVARVRAAARPWGLTDRELDVLLLTLDGWTCGQVAIRLGVGRETARTHIRHIREKSQRTTETLRRELAPPGK